jgi:glycosyltransferase involved in cell wall biosynthesis
MRFPVAGLFSIEQLFCDIRNTLSDEFDFTVNHCRFHSKGIFRRLSDILIAVGRQGDVNHVTGDIHYLTFLLKRRRTILTIHDCVTLERLSGIRRFIYWLLWYWLPEKKCAAIVVVSDATRMQLLTHLRCDPNKIRVIHNHVAKDFIKSEHTFNPFNPRILHIGTAANKNLERHIEALEGIACELVIIGRLSKEQIAKLQKRSIRFANFVDLSRAELVAQYNRCDMLLFCSTYEGFGIPILEAQAVGRPVVTSDLWSMPEVAGAGACLVNPFESNSIREGVLKVLQDSFYREELVRLGLANVELFSLEETGAKYAELYREVYSH